MRLGVSNLGYLGKWWYALPILLMNIRKKEKRKKIEDAEYKFSKRANLPIKNVMSTLF